MSYWKNLNRGIWTTLGGLRLAIQHFFGIFKRKPSYQVMTDNYFAQFEGTFTVQYPKEKIPVPDHGRYQLHNEIDDCIVCDKCAKVCPVDCIDIEPIRSPETFGETSDGTPKRIYAAKFDIDMSKCCFCGLCTTVCPTECLTMTPEYDFSTYDIGDHNFPFANLTEAAIQQRKKEWEVFQEEKATKPAATTKAGGTALPKPRPFRPKTK